MTKMVFAALSFFSSVMLYGQPDSLEMTAVVADTVYFENGKINRIEISKTAFEYYGATYYFENNLPFDDRWKEKKVWQYSMIYYYNDDWSVREIKKDTVFPWSPFSHPDYEVMLGKDHYSLISNSRTGDTVDFTVSVINWSDLPIQLNASFSSPALYAAPLLLPPKDTTLFTFHLITEQESHNYKVILSNDSITRSFKVLASGYDITGDDIATGQILTLGKTVVYQQAGTEALLNIYNMERTEVLQRIPLSRAKITIDFSDLKPGTYWIEKSDYSKKELVWCMVVIK